MMKEKEDRHVDCAVTARGLRKHKLDEIAIRQLFPAIAERPDDRARRADRRVGC